MRANWDAAPINGNSLTFTGTTQQTIVNDTALNDVSQITFSNGGFDISGNRPKVVEFRGKTYCSANHVPPRKWKLYPAKQRARWRKAPNPLREDWKNKDQCR